MVELDWLICWEPVRMLDLLTKRHTHTGEYAGLQTPSDRKLRLFCVACCWGVSAKLGWDAEWCVAEGKGSAKNAADWAWCWAGDQKRPTAAERADLLRCIIGNPFRPVRQAVYDNPGCPNKQQRHPDQMCTCPPWLTPQVFALAQAAYQERAAEECKECRGRGGWWRCPNCGGEWRGDVGPDCFVCSAPRLSRMECGPCRDTGYLETGRLDPHRLAVLSDALEEAGAPADGEGACPKCRNGYLGQWKTCGYCGGNYSGDRMGCMFCRKGRVKLRERCGNCKGSGKIKVPHPLLEHLRSPGPHVRGCWVVDLILGEE